MIAPFIDAPTLEVTTARPADVPAIARLLRRCEPETVPVPALEILEDRDRYLVVRADGAGVVGTAARHDTDAGDAELRSLAVDPDWRGLRIGARLVKRVQQECRRSGRELACITLEPEFFARLGFHRTDLDSVPRRADRPAKVDGRRRVAMAWRPRTAASETEASA